MLCPVGPPEPRTCGRRRAERRRSARAPQPGERGVGGRGGVRVRVGERADQDAVGLVDREADGDEREQGEDPDRVGGGRHGPGKAPEPDGQGGSHDRESGELGFRCEGCVGFLVPDDDGVVVYSGENAAQ